jgi:hypothetical protein
MENETFVWTDKLVREFDRYYKSDDSAVFQTVQDAIDAFKQSKQQSVVNNEWEIVSFYRDETKWIKQPNGYYRNNYGSEFPYGSLMFDEKGASVKNGKIKIHSVRRINDGEVFTVGDEVCFQRQSNLHFVIDNFCIRQDKVMLARSKDDGFGGSVVEVIDRACDLKKAKPILFKTKDGKSVYEDDEYWYADIKESSCPTACKYNASFGGHYGNSYSSKTFSTQEAAEQYIKDNNPDLVNQKLIESIRYYEENIPYFSYNNLKEIAFNESIEDGVISISLDSLKKFIKDKLK